MLESIPFLETHWLPGIGLENEVLFQVAVAINEERIETCRELVAGGKRGQEIASRIQACKQESTAAVCSHRPTCASQALRQYVPP